jgi:hypothetical protein
MRRDSEGWGENGGCGLKAGIKQKQCGWAELGTWW